MQDVSPEEAEYNFNKILEKLITQPEYMSASLEKFWENPTDNGAKILWLKYTKQGRNIPQDVMDRMIDVIEFEVLGFKSKLYPEQIPEQVFELIYLAASKKGNNLNRFWNILHNPSELNFLGTAYFDEELLDKARRFFPFEKKLKIKDLYSFAAEYLEIDDEKYKSTAEQLVRRNYRYFKKKYKADR